MGIQRTLSDAGVHCVSLGLCSSHMLARSDESSASFNLSSSMALKLLHHTLSSPPVSHTAVARFKNTVDRARVSPPRTARPSFETRHLGHTPHTLHPGRRPWGPPKMRTPYCVRRHMRSAVQGLPQLHTKSH